MEHLLYLVVAAADQAQQAPQTPQDRELLVKDMRAVLGCKASVAVVVVAVADRVAPEEMVLVGMREQQGMVVLVLHPQLRGLLSFALEAVAVAAVPAEHPALGVMEEAVTVQIVAAPQHQEVLTQAEVAAAVAPMETGASMVALVS